MSWTRLVPAALLSAVLVAAAVQQPASESEPVRVRPGHAYTAPTAPAVPVRLTADIAEAPSESDTAEAAEAQIDSAPAEVVEPEAPAATRSLGSGIASYYGAELAGNPTASGERFDPSDLTAAHRTLPFGTRLEVMNVRTGASVVVRVNDRGPFHGARVLDLSHEAARQIGLDRAGTGRVEIAAVEG